MIDLPSEVATHLTARGGVKLRVLWWVIAKNRETNEPETLGIWNGDDHETFTIEGEPRTYFGAGAMLNVGDLTSEATLNVRSLDIDFSAVSPAVKTALRQYEPRFAPVQVHVIFFDPLTNNMIGTPVRVFKGWLNKAPIKTPAKGGMGSARISMLGHSRMLTRTLSARRSNENQQKREAGDAFFQYADISGTVITPWGSDLVSYPPPKNNNNNIETGTRRGGVV